MSKPSPTLPELAALPELRRHGERAKLLWVNYLNELGLQQRAAHENVITRQSAKCRSLCSACVSRVV